MVFKGPTCEYISLVDFHKSVPYGHSQLGHIVAAHNFRRLLVS